MLHIAPSASEYILSQPAALQQQILDALKAIEADPVTVGTYLPFPHQPGIQGYTTTDYFLTYRVIDSRVEVC